MERWSPIAPHVGEQLAIGARDRPSRHLLLRARGLRARRRRVARTEVQPTAALLGVRTATRNDLGPIGPRHCLAARRGNLGKRRLALRAAARAVAPGTGLARSPPSYYLTNASAIEVFIYPASRSRGAARTAKVRRMDRPRKRREVPRAAWREAWAPEHRSVLEVARIRGGTTRRRGRRP